jgi:hypothetical protein
MEKKIIERNLSMTGILKWLIEKYIEKKSGEPFKLQDVQGYITREKIPDNYGGFTIKKSENKYNKLYNLIEA